MQNKPPGKKRRGKPVNRFTTQVDKSTIKREDPRCITQPPEESKSQQKTQEQGSEIPKWLENLKAGSLEQESEKHENKDKEAENGSRQKGKESGHRRSPRDAGGNPWRLHRRGKS
ncbi:unnamed protein product [Linum trigynum]|uniref:Uncharacterized protein n=1 Tax=Linum trigynum TaxID=586398 RepID=A0AAV2DMT7_9ROSI